GDVEVSFGNFEETSRRVEETVSGILEAGVIPLCLGGEHTITYPVLKAYKDKPFYLVYDAHMDFREDYLENRFSHACVTRRVGELVGYENILIVGVRSALKDEFEDIKGLGVKYIDYNSCDGDLAERIAQVVDGKDVYLSIDADVFDPKETAGVCNPEPPGLTFREFVSSLDFLKKVNMVGMDFVEISPLYDSYAQILAAKAIFKVLLKYERGRGADR
ncbi:MAG: arginase family protein, partial [Candidatus Hydrothermarchaeota archaeon]